MSFILCLPYNNELKIRYAYTNFNELDNDIVSRFNTWNGIGEYYEKKLSSHSCSDLIELTISLHRKKQQVLEQKRKFGAIDERYMKRAEDLLFGELSVVLDIPKHEVRQFISSRLEVV